MDGLLSHKTAPDEPQLNLTGKSSIAKARIEYQFKQIRRKKKTVTTLTISQTINKKKQNYSILKEYE